MTGSAKLSDKPVAVPRYIASRYVSAGKRSHLVSFMSAIAIAGLALSIAILITVLSVMNGFDRELRENVLGIVPHVTLTTDEPLREESWQQLIDSLEARPGVESATAYTQLAGVIASPEYVQGVLINGVDAQEEARVSSLDRFMTSGSLLALDEDRWGIVLGQTLAQQLQVTLGDEVDIFSTSIAVNPLSPLPTFRSFRVSGIFRVGTQELDSSLVLINQSAARALFRLRTPYNGVRVMTDDVLAADTVAIGIRGQLGNEFNLSSWTRQFGAIYENIRFSETIIALMLWLLVGIAAFNLVVSLIMTVRDKTGDIAILRTLGASPQTISRLFMWQGCLIAAAGIAIGVTLGVIASLQVSDFAAFIERVFNFRILNAEVYPIDFLPSDLQLNDVLLVTGGVLLLTLFATMYPARRAAAIHPAQALRGE